jgi:hypothetical protein
MLFDFDSLSINKLVVEAAEIVEKLVGNDTFFLHTFGSVLRLITGEYLIVKSNITDEDILQIRTNLKCTVSYDMEPPQTSYMECDPGMPGTPSDIIMNPSVRSRALPKFVLFHSLFHFFSGWDLFSQRSHQAQRGNGNNATIVTLGLSVASICCSS